MAAGQEPSGLKSWDGGPESYRPAASREVFPCSLAILGISQTAIIDNWDYVKVVLHSVLNGLNHEDSAIK